MLEMNVPPPDTEQTDETYIARWPIAYTPPGVHDQSGLYGFRSPWSDDRCAQCGKRLAEGELCLGDNYHDSECGHYLCMRCAEPLLDRERVPKMQPDGCLGIDQLKVTVVAGRCSPDLRTPSAVLLGPHSDNGMPQARTSEQTSNVDVVFDAGESVVVERVKIHNWYVGCYPARVEVAAFSDLGMLDGERVLWLHQVGAGPLRKASVWSEVDCAARWPVDHSGERIALRYIRLRFSGILEPSQYGHMCLGVVLFE